MYLNLRHRDLFRSYKITESWLSGVDSSCDMSLQLAWRQGGRALAPFKRRSVSGGSLAQMGAMKLVMEKQISLEWLDSARPKVQVENPSKVFVCLRGAGLFSSIGCPLLLNTRLDRMSYFSDILIEDEYHYIDDICTDM